MHELMFSEYCFGFLTCLLTFRRIEIDSLSESSKIELKLDKRKTAPGRRTAKAKRRTEKATKTISTERVRARRRRQLHEPFLAELNIPQGQPRDANTNRSLLILICSLIVIRGFHLANALDEASILLLTGLEWCTFTI